MEIVSVPVAPAASVTVTITVYVPTSELVGVPDRVAVEAPAVWVIDSQLALVAQSQVIVYESPESSSSSLVAML